MAVEIREKISPKTHSRSDEIIGIALAALAVLLFLCLVSYSSSDWSLNSTGLGKTQNWIGITGAVTADLLFQTIGLTAYFLPFLLGLIAFRFIRAEEISASVGRVIGYVFFVAAAASLFVIFGWQGGILGAFFANNLTWMLSKIGAGILLAALLTTSILLITNLSFAAFFGDFSFYWSNFRMRLEEMFGGYRRWSETRAKSKQARLEQERVKSKEKPAAKKTPISTGDTFAVNPSDVKDAAIGESNNSVGEKLSSIFKKIGAAKKLTATESVEKKSEKESEAEEIPISKTLIVEEKNESAEIETSEPIFASRYEEPIAFTPTQPTGELTAETLDQKPLTATDTAEDEANDDALPAAQIPQNYDAYILPKAEFLNPPPPRVQVKEDEARAQAKDLEEKTKEFNATGKVVNICPGPVVTTYEFKPDPGVKYSRITGLADDLCLALEAESIRIDRIPGKAFVGIEVPNNERDTIHLREVIESKKFEGSKSLLTLALGKTIDGLNYAADLAKMPHLLIAGATGAGKSVGVNTLVVSILYKAKPDEVKFIMVDPKQVELGIYADIPHLATPIITDPKRAANSLKWAVSQMEKRYKDLAGWGVRNIDGYNAEVEKRNATEELNDEGEAWKKIPYIVIIIDELADLMMVAGKEVEESITRLAQMARAVGIHLVLATQRPSVDVITGLIKANFPSRISFRVSSKVDSRTIIDANGAESLLGKGDMLFLPPGTSQIIRVHGAFVDEKEIAKIVEHIKAQGRPEYDTTITKTEDELVDVDDLPGRRDPLFADALKTVVVNKSASTSLLQRHLRIGYGRAAAILDAMVREGYIGEMDGSKRGRPIMQKAFDDLQEAAEGREI